VGVRTLAYSACSLVPADRPLFGEDHQQGRSSAPNEGQL
jgi:hypothetical protein